MRNEKVFNNLALNNACVQQHGDVLEKGFTPQPVATNLMLIVSELGEACEADRKNNHADYEMFEGALKAGYPEGAFKVAFEQAIKDSFEDEIADAFLRLMDLCGEYGIDIERHIQLKAMYNKLRPAKHGKAY